MKKIATLVLVADLGGTAVFALEGAIAAMRSGLDLLGILVVSFAVALGGGVIRDLLIGAAPPSAVRDWHYPALAFAVGLLAFAVRGPLHALPALPLTTLDAAGLALFAVAGTEKALDHRIGALASALMGTITGVGGGVVRDLLLNRIPAVLLADIYASAAFAGGMAVVLARRGGLAAGAAALLGGALCFGLRMAAVIFGWQLPRVGHW